jgi:3'(2'), 5'-bisphosphate nucleotidase
MSYCWAASSTKVAVLVQMSMSLYAKELSIALKAVRQASLLTQQIFRTASVSQITKSDASPVTLADYASQCCINTLIHESFPDDKIVAEEDTSDLSASPIMAALSSLVHTWRPMTHPQILESIALGGYAGGNKDRFWTLDPIDGTKGFLRGGQYAICLALIEEGQVVLGVLACPNLPLGVLDSNGEGEGERGSMYFAIKGHGAFETVLTEDTFTPRKKGEGERGSVYFAIKGHGAFETVLTEDTFTPRKIMVDDGTETSQTGLLCSVESGHSSASHTSQICTLLGNPREIKIDSQCKYAVVARGGAGMYIRIPTVKAYEEKIWDHASGSLIVAEAGGKVTDAYGLELDFGQGRTLKGNKGIVCTSEGIYQKVIAAVTSVLAE